MEIIGFSISANDRDGSFFTFNYVKEHNDFSEMLVHLVHEGAESFLGKESELSGVQLHLQNGDALSTLYF